MNTNWDLTHIYENREDFNSDINKAEENIEKFEKLNEDFKANFSEILSNLVETTELVSRIASFANMKRDEDSTVALGQELALESDNLINKYSSKISFFMPSVLSLSEEELEELIEKNNLEEYRKYLSDIFRFKDHTLSKGEEYILGSVKHMSNSPQNAYYMLTNADMTFPKIKSKDGKELTSANYTNFLTDPDVKVRKEAFDAMYDTYGSLENTISTLYNDNVNNLVTEAKLRNYDSARMMELYQDDVDTIVYDNLIESVRANLPILHEYYRIKKDFLNLDDQHMYDVYLPLNKDLDVEIKYDEAIEIIKEAVKPMGEDYASVIASAFEDGWIDVYPRKGKRNGAYSAGVYGVHPYVLMNYTDDLNSLFTLAHELGHAMHSYYSSKNNDFIYHDYTIFAAEVASTTNELLLLNYLLDRTENADERLLLIDHYIDSFKSTVFRQTMFAEFEKNTHEKVESSEVLTLNWMNDMYYKLNEDYYGDHVVIDEKIKLEWLRIPHFYRNFYVYKYATGFLSAVILSNKILAGENTDKYINFLSDGSKHFPIDQLKACGADIEKPQTFNSAFSVFESLVKELDSLIS